MPNQSPDKEFADLTRDIDWQRASFLSNNLEIVWSSEPNRASYSPEETTVRTILDHYLLLAMLFCRQLRNDLKKEFSQGNIQSRDVKVWMQEGLDKLVQEWYRVYAAILAIRSNHSTNRASEIIRTMQPVMKTAMEDVFLSGDFLAVLHFGQDYSMRFFNYLENIAALNMPLATFESPWEWTILWHELAGEKARSVKNTDPHFFETMLYDIAAPLDETQIAEAVELGWSVDWLEELIEDSFSVANFPIHFLFVLKSLLERSLDPTDKESRHPPQNVRLATAMAFHLQRKGFAASPADLQTWDEEKWRATWDELDETEREPDRFREFDPVTLLGDQSVQFKMAWSAAGRILNWHEQQGAKPDVQDNNAIRRLIGDAIIGYSRGGERGKIIDDAKGALNPILNNAHEDPQIAVDQDLVQIEQLVSSRSIVDNEQQLDFLEEQNPKVRKLLRDAADAKLPYKDLLSVQFDDVDFGVETVTNVKYKNNLKFNTAKLNGIITASPAGKVTFTNSKNANVITTKILWNNAAASGYEIED